MRHFTSIIFSAILLSLAFVANAHSQQVQRVSLDVSDYKMDVQLLPEENRLKATVDVVFSPAADTRTVTFELNGSLIVESVARILDSAAVTAPGPAPIPTKTKTAPLRGVQPLPTPVPVGPQVTFIQDRVGVSNLGPSVRIDLGETVKGGTRIILRFKYNGILVNPEGGPLLTKRLAYVGAENGYLMYAARWFPFNDYAADRATSDITVTVPKQFTLAGYSDESVTNVNGRQRFVQKEPGLIGNFAYDKYVVATKQFGDTEIQFYSKAAPESVVDLYAETLGKALQFYSKKYGPAGYGKRMIVAQIDDDSLDFYSAQGMIFMAQKYLDQSRDLAVERLQREAAFQWWGLTVGLKSFDDAWISQGLAEYSAVMLREDKLTGAKLEALRRELLEKSLTFEQTASLARAPSTLDDQSVAYQYIMYGKGAFVYKLLQYTMGEEKFQKLLKTFIERYKGRNASIDEFEKLASEIQGDNMRYFFARWVEGTGVPEFAAEYQILRTKEGKFVTRGTVRQNYDNLRLPLELVLKSEGDSDPKPVIAMIDDSSQIFSIESDGKPLDVVIDPSFKLLRTSDDLRVSSIARRGIEQFKEGNFVEAQQQFEAALKLDRSNAWVYYHLGLLFLAQRNYDLAIDNFKVITTGIKERSNPGWLYVWSYIKMGNAYDAKGDRDRAVNAYKAAEKLGDDYDGAQDAVKKYLGMPYDPKAGDK